MIDYKTFKKILDQKNLEIEREGSVLAFKSDRPKLDSNGNLWSGIHGAYINPETGKPAEQKDEK